MKLNESKSYKALKNISLIRQVGWGLVCFILLLILFLAFVPWQQTAYGIGRVIAYDPTERQQVISAPLEGRLNKWYVQEGSVVKKGDLIVEIQDNDPSLLQNLEMEKIAIHQQLIVLKEMIKVAKINVNRQKTLFDEGVSARKQYEQALIQYNQYLAEEGKTQAELSRLTVRIARQQSQRVVASIDGTILSRYAGQNGVLVKAGDILAEIVPATNSRAVEMTISGNDVPLVQIGDNVRLQFEGWPGIQFSGWPSVAIGTFGGKVAVIDAADNGLGKFRLLVVANKDEDWPEPRYLRQGVRAHGWVMLGRVALWFELWRRFNGFPPSQSAPAPKGNSHK